MNNQLLEAVAIFKALGWESVTPENIHQLPLGTKEQKQTALSGLKSGEWGEFAQLSENTYGWRSYLDVEAGKLALFAIRLGVDARRAVNIATRNDDALLIAAIESRGAKYASDFISFACISSRRGFEHAPSTFGSLAVRLVDRLALDIPQNVEYMKDWSAYAAAAMGLKAERRYGETGLPPLELIKKRFFDHIFAGVSVNTPATGPFGAVLPAGVKRGWLSREKAMVLVFFALDAAIRPGDRKVWIDVLYALDVSDAELHARVQSLIPILASGDSAVVARLAPALIAQAEGSLLSELLLSAFSATTKKTRQLVLKAALGRPRPADAEDLAPWLSALADDKDRTTAVLSTRLMAQWGISPETPREEKPDVQGLWQKTPLVWQVPPFEQGEASPERLTELAAELVRQPAVIHDVTAERFLSMANALARRNPEETRTSLQGLPFGDFILLSNIVHWVREDAPRYGFDIPGREPYDPLVARDYVVCLHLGKLPCLLSTPSYDDLSISVPDLAGRLAHYQEAGTDALEADLLLALTRLDIETSTSEAVKSLQELNVETVLQSGDKMSVTAGQVVLRYLDDPFKETLQTVSRHGYMYSGKPSMPNALSAFPDRVSWYMEERFSVFPLWGDSALHAVRWNGEVYHEKGLILRQVARRASPLPPGASINLLAAQRSVDVDDGGDSIRAVTEAWQRGLLRPGVADVAMLDWSESPPFNLAALASALEMIAREGLLSVVWPVIDDLIGASLKAPRLLAGTAEIAELAAAFLPEVQFAIKNGDADKVALDLQGIRSLALHGGTSRAVSAAQKLVRLLPPVDTAPEGAPRTPVSLNPPFDGIWVVHEDARPLIDDGIALTVDWAELSPSKKCFLFTLALPGVEGRVFQVVKDGWYYDLEGEGQCQAYPVAPGTAIFSGNRENSVWLHWDETQEAMVVSAQRNWREEKDAPLKGVKPPLTASLLTILIGLLAQDGDAVYFAPRLVHQFFKAGYIGEEIIRRATLTLLRYPAVSPAKLARVLEKNLALLPALWPMLTECVKAAGLSVASGEAPPIWVNRVLDIALRYAPYLEEAAKRGLIPAQDAQWAGLFEIAASKAKSAAVAKAKKLTMALGL